MNIQIRKDIEPQTIMGIEPAEAPSPPSESSQAVKEQTPEEELVS